MMSKPETERRRSKRFQMELPVTVKAQDGTERKCVTKDLSAGGVFFYSDLEIAQDSPIQLVMILPPEITGEERQRVCCHGRVVRAVGDSAGGQRGVGVKVERLEFLPEITAKE
jgi:PilZ domain-containing protein